MKKILVALVALIALATVPADVASADAEVFHLKERYPVIFHEYVPCANGGAGEWVQLEGYLHGTWHVTQDATWVDPEGDEEPDNPGGFHIQFHANTQGMHGVGLTTGDEYVSSTRRQFSANNAAHPGETYVAVERIKVNGKGQASDFDLEYRLRYNINANGEITVENFEFTYVCS